jgi:hypothetical protein
MSLWPNPCYAGALAYGRTEAKTTTEDGRARKSSTRRRKPRDQWKVLIIGNHVGYIDWETYLENLAILDRIRDRISCHVGIDLL